MRYVSLQVTLASCYPKHLILMQRVYQNKMHRMQTFARKPEKLQRRLNLPLYDANRRSLTNYADLGWE